MPVLQKIFARYFGTVRTQGLAWCLVTWAPHTGAHREGELTEAYDVLRFPDR